MHEEFLQFIWKYGLFDRNALQTTEGDPVEVIYLGEENRDAGPDFLGARIRIGSTVWAGNVEIHTRSSDWFAHGHHMDKAYDNVIMHVVYRNGQPATRSSGGAIPTLLITPSETMEQQFRKLIGSQEKIPCRDKMARIDPLILESWLSSLVVERLGNRAGYIRELLSLTQNNWEEAFYISLARSFGFRVNADPFEWLARSIPLSVLLRHRDQPLQVEALLMGQAGFLTEGTVYPGYPGQLRREYLHLRRKYNLKPLENHIWKFLRLRPVNFPTIRIAQFASLICHTEHIFAAVVNTPDMGNIRQIFSVRASEFWDTHYTFDKSAARRVKTLGEKSYYSLVINTMIPFLFVFGKQNGQEALKERALQWLNQMPAESNRIIRRFSRNGVDARTGFYSQALLQLSENYCNHRHCLACGIGIHLITREVG